MPVERCPKCGGRLLGGVREGGQSYHYPASDTLEGIEAEAGAKTDAILKGLDYPERREGHVKAVIAQRDTLIQALRRLFNGCTECGREPLAQTRLFTSDDVLAARRQAFQQAAEMVADGINPYGVLTIGEVLRKLYQLAEDA